MSDCIFCKIAAGEMVANVVYEDDKVISFKDINPKAEVHVLVVPRHHVETLMELDAAAGDPADLMSGIQKTAEAVGIAKSGFKVLANVGKGGGQIVPHLHFHLLAGPIQGLPV